MGGRVFQTAVWVGLHKGKCPPPRWSPSEFIAFFPTGIFLQLAPSPHGVSKVPRRNVWRLGDPPPWFGREDPPEDPPGQACPPSPSVPFHRTPAPPRAGQPWEGQGAPRDGQACRQPQPSPQPQPPPGLGRPAAPRPPPYATAALVAQRRRATQSRATHSVDPSHSRMGGLCAMGRLGFGSLQCSAPQSASDDAGRCTFLEAKMVFRCRVMMRGCSAFFGHCQVIFSHFGTLRYFWPLLLLLATFAFAHFWPLLPFSVCFWPFLAILVL